MFILTIKIKLLKNYQNPFYCTIKRLILSSSFVLPSCFIFFLSLPLLIFRRSWLMTNSKVYDIIMSLDWILKTRFFNVWWSKALILMIVKLIEYYIETIFVEKNGCPKVTFRLLHWQEDSLAFSVLITALVLYDLIVTQSLGLWLSPKVWPSI